MNRAAIVAPVRTPGGLAGGGLSAMTAQRLAATAIAAAVERSGLDGARVDDVVLSGATTGDPRLARPAARTAGLPGGTPGFDLERRCGNGLYALITAAMMVRTGAAEVVVAAGVDRGSSAEDAAIPADLAGVEQLAQRYGITRADAEEFALRSHRKAARAWRQGSFGAEVAPVKVITPASYENYSPAPHLMEHDEAVREDMTTRALTALRPLWPDGVLTPGVLSVPGSGAAACLVVAEHRLADLGLEPIAYLTNWAAAACPTPERLPIAAPAVEKVLSRSGFDRTDLDLLEIDEKTAVDVLALLRHLDQPVDLINVNGGSIALGDPTAATGLRITTTLLHELARRGGGSGLAVTPLGPDAALAALFESPQAPTLHPTPRGARFHGVRPRRPGRHRT
ncbi:acetyl-CoA acetyltransferase [Nocardia sp. CDC159]|uniref:Probable acetyl-CoA acetyltransferase n=1 Tax=Nocardia pulmonis TaxID=2951408 RepID=A0A9X2EBX1_9NOCA|nr:MULTISPECIES: acetyl-CoA acetyltransferase [Nocardia]MCM6777574.1 acetyl-CoA acetyltransferase [Nocardia pulmonis]MCM6790319.1 acetyl-CoA acetyltransferase [Nocardia sp. CDC159]